MYVSGVRVALFLSLLLSLAGCADPNVTPQRLQFGDADAIATGPALRIVSERPRQIPGDGTLPTMCSEPSPDVAVAFGRSLAAQGSYSETGAPTVSGNVNAASTEAATALAGRTAGVLALRDGLYAACQSYTNGVLGHDAYALILSQYGNLLVALAGPGSSTPAVYSAYSPQDAAVSSLLVACVSEHDPTRLGALRSNQTREYNSLLSTRFCSGLLATIASGKLVHAPAAPKKVASVQDKPDKNATVTTVKVNTTKTTTTTPPATAAASPPVAK